MKDNEIPVIKNYLNEYEFKDEYIERTSYCILQTFLLEGL